MRTLGGLMKVCAQRPNDPFNQAGYRAEARDSQWQQGIEIGGCNHR